MHTDPTPEPQEAEQKSEPKETATGRLKEKLRQHLEGARVRLEEVKRAITGLREGDRGALEQKRKEVHQRLDAQQARAEQLRSEKAGHGKPAPAGHETGQDREQLVLQAELAEAYAINTVMVAMMDADEVEVAVLEALIAHEVLDAYLETQEDGEPDEPRDY